MEPERKQQWHLLIQISHGPSFGHEITMQQKLRGHDAGPRERIGSWTGLGVPETVLNQATAIIQAVITEHVVTRYGVAGELPLKWAGDPDPF